MAAYCACSCRCVRLKTETGLGPSCPDVRAIRGTDRSQPIPANPDINLCLRAFLANSPERICQFLRINSACPLPSPPRAHVRADSSEGPNPRASCDASHPQFLCFPRAAIKNDAGRRNLGCRRRCSQSKTSSSAFMALGVISFASSLTSAMILRVSIVSAFFGRPPGLPETPGLKLVRLKKTEGNGRMASALVPPQMPSGIGLSAATPSQKRGRPPDLASLAAEKLLCIFGSVTAGRCGLGQAELGPSREACSMSPAFRPARIRPAGVN